jgi:hypothetical protein
MERILAAFVSYSRRCRRLGFKELTSDIEVVLRGDEVDGCLASVV